MKRLFVIPLLLAFLRCGANPGAVLSGEDRAQYLQQIGIEKVLLTDGREDSRHLYVLDNVSTSARRITATPAVRTGAWSPDGRWVAFQELGDGVSNSSLNVMKEDGTGIRRLVDYPSGPAILSFRWSPDGSALCFRVGPPTGTVYTIRADGSGLTAIDAPWASTVGPAGVFSLPGEPAWSPDSRTLAYEALYTGDTVPQVYAVNPDGSGRRRLTRTPGAARDPSWSPDGRRVVFDSDGQVFAVNADGTGQRQVVGGAASPVWSPTGEAIAVELASGDLGVVNADGTGLRTVVTLRADESLRFGSWSPDGSRMVFLGSSGGRLSLYAVRSSGGDLRNLVDDVGTFDVKWK